MGTQNYNVSFMYVVVYHSKNIFSSLIHMWMEYILGFYQKKTKKGSYGLISYINY